MSGSRTLRACLIGLLLTSCTGTAKTADPVAEASRRAAACAGDVGSLLDVTQRYLNGLEGTRTTGASPAPSADPGQVADEAEFAQATKDIRSYAAARKCDPVAFQRDLTSGLERLKAGGPVARAVLLQLQAGPSPARTEALRPGDDIAAALATAASGTTVRLGSGTFTLPDTVALLRGVTIVGAGRDRTRLESASAGGPLLVLTDEKVTLDGLTVRRTGAVAGPVVSAGPVATLVLRAARVSGARADTQGQGGVGILMSGGAGGQTGASRRTSLSISDSELIDNAVAGAVVAGEHRADIRSSLVARSGQCGICFLGTSDGVVRDSRFEANGAGLVIGGDARPKVLAAVISGGQVGIQAIDNAAPEIIHVTVTGTARAAMIWTATARGRVEASSCVKVPFGIVVGPRALPFLGSNACLVARGRQ